jgi:catechol 2,3-dioxygenase-like lactoylglutathione lyase family enzyme
VRATEYAVPTLPSRDLAETLAFYERLGFHNAGDPPAEWGYLIVRRGSIELHFYPDDHAASHCFVWVDDVDALHEAWQVDPPADTPWGVRTLEVVDPSGNRVAFGTGPH